MVTSVPFLTLIASFSVYTSGSPIFPAALAPWTVPASCSLPFISPLSSDIVTVFWATARLIDDNFVRCSKHPEEGEGAIDKRLVAYILIIP